MQLTIKFNDESDARVIEAPTTEPFVDVLYRTFGDLPDSTYHVIERGDDGIPNTAYMVDSRTTVQQVSDLADGRTINVDAEGRGGGTVPTLWELVNTGLTLYGLWELGRGVDAWRVGRAFRTHRRAATAWLDAGAPDLLDMELRQLVKARDVWNRSEFDEAFGLDRQQGSRLLSVARYRRDPKLRMETWFEEAE